MLIRNIKSFMGSIKTLPLAVLIASTVISCSNSENKSLEIKEKAQEKAAKYLTGTEYIKATEHANKHFLTTSNFVGLEKSVYYLDSLLIDAKANEAYFKGIQMVKDSINGRPYKRPEYKIPVDTTFKNISPQNKNYERKILQELAKYKTGKEIKDIIDKKPQIIPSKYPQANPAIIHYYCTLASIGAQKEAFNAGVEYQNALESKVKESEH